MRQPLDENSAFNSGLIESIPGKSLYCFSIVIKVGLVVTIIPNPVTPQSVPDKLQSFTLT